MARILALAGSNSSTSINFELVRHTTTEIRGHELQLVELARKHYPMYSEDLERDSGIPEGIEELYQWLKTADGLLLSVNEHNGNPSAFTKNFLDWLSRRDRSFMENLPVFLMSTSRGRGGAQSSRERVEQMLTRFGAQIVSQFSLPSFNHTFRKGEGITDSDLKTAHAESRDAFLNVLKG